MELYKRYPWLCTIWAFFEVVCFGGVVFGWGSLVFILKEEGFYGEECIMDLDTFNSTIESHIQLITDRSKSNETSYFTHHAKSNVDGLEVDVLPVVDAQNDIFHIVKMPCPSQESKLNLWFSISVSFMYLSFTGIGYLIRTIGVRFTRLMFLIVYLIGSLCLAFASPDIPWLLLPGLCCMGTAGLVILATNLQVANLHPHIRSTIVAIFTGLFDFSSLMKQLIKVAYENGIPRRSCYIFVSCAVTVSVLISTLIMLPHKSISEKMVADIKRKRQSVKNNNTENDHEKDALAQVEQEKAEEHIHFPENEENNNTPSLCATLLSLTVILHLYWLFVHALRFVTFIGLVNRWLEDVTNNDEQKVGQLLSTFAYMTMGSIGTALLCGFIYDWQRRKFADSGPIKKVYRPVVLPMCLVIVYSIGTTILCYIKNSITPYFAFVVFTFFRSSLFTVAVAFVGDAFPMDYFGVLFGFIQFAAGIAGLIQYPIFEWYEAYMGSYEHVNILMLALQVSTIVHPLLLFIRARRDHGKGPRMELFIEKA